MKNPFLASLFYASAASILLFSCGNASHSTLTSQDVVDDAEKLSVFSLGLFNPNTMEYLKILSNSSGTWSSSTLSFRGSGTELGLTWDSNAKLYLIHSIGLPNFNMTSNFNGTWASESISTTHTINTLNFAAASDSSKNIHLFYAGDGYSITYRKRTAGAGWGSASTVVGGTWTLPFKNFSAAVDASNTPHVVATRPAGGSNMYPATVYGGSGGSTVLQTCSAVSTGSIVTDANRKAHIVAYCEKSSPVAKQIVYFTNQSGTFVSTVLSSSAANIRPSMTIDSLGILHLTFADAAGKVMYLNRSTAGSWSAVTTIENAPGYTLIPQIAADSSGKAHVFYVKDWGGASVMYASNATGAWSIPTAISSSLPTGTQMFWGVAASGQKGYNNF